MIKADPERVWGIRGAGGGQSMGEEYRGKDMGKGYGGQGMEGNLVWGKGMGEGYGRQGMEGRCGGQGMEGISYGGLGMGASVWGQGMGAAYGAGNRSRVWGHGMGGLGMGAGCMGDKGVGSQSYRGWVVCGRQRKEGGKQDSLGNWKQDKWGKFSMLSTILKEIENALCFSIKL